MSENTRIGLAALAVVAAILATLALADRIDRWGDALADYRRWFADACIPGPGQVTIARHRDGKITCTILSGTEYGRVPAVVSAAVLEPPL